MAMIIKQPLSQDASRVAGADPLIGAPTDLRSGIRLLARERTFYRTLIEQSLDGVGLFDRHGNSLYQSPANKAIHGWLPQHLEGMAVNRTLVHPDDQPAMHALWKRLLAEPGGRERMQLRLLHQQGHWITIESQIRNCLQVPGIEAMVNYFRDISELKRLETRLRRLATTDGMTMLANRRHFMERGRQEQRRARRNGTELAVVLMDIDHFKRVNDSSGHAAGDRVIIGVARLLRSMMRDQDVAGRLGGEEFALLLPDTDLTGAAQLAQRLRHSLEQQRIEQVDGATLRVTASFGVAALHGSTPHAHDSGIDRLLRDADAALYQAKHDGRNCVRPDST